MTVTEEKENPPGGTARRSPVGSFVTATVSFVAVFAAGSTAIPLYGAYRSVNGVTDAGFSLVAAGYFVCAVFALLVLGRLSDHLGRKLVSILALLLAAAGCVVLMMVDGLGPLLGGRALQGLAAGLASSALAAFVVDTAPKRPAWLAPTVTSAGATVGLSLGVFGAGSLVQFGPEPRHLSYALFAAALVLCAALVASTRETVRRRRGVLASLRPRFSLPDAARPLLPAACGVFVSTWALGGYFTSFGPSIAADYLGSHAPLVAAAVFASYMAPSVFGGPLAGRMSPGRAQRAGMLLVAIAALSLTGATALGSAGLFIVAGVLGGFGMGLALSGSMASMLGHAAPVQRAGLLALVYAISYTGSALPALLAGQLSRATSLFGITCGYAGLGVVACVWVFIWSREASARRTPR